MRSKKPITEELKLRYLGFLNEVYEVCQTEQKVPVTKTKRVLSRKHKMNSAVWTPLYKGGIVETKGSSRGLGNKEISQLRWLCNDRPSIHMATELIKRAREYYTQKQKMRTEKEKVSKNEAVEFQRACWRESTRRKRVRKQHEKAGLLPPVFNGTIKDVALGDVEPTIVPSAKEMKEIAAKATQPQAMEAPKEEKAKEIAKTAMQEFGQLNDLAKKLLPFLERHAMAKIEEDAIRKAKDQPMQMVNIPSDKPVNLLLGVGNLTIEIKVG